MRRIHSGEDDQPVSIGSNYARGSDSALRVDVLVAVKKPTRMGAAHVAVERLEAEVHFVLAVVDHAWRVVGDKYIDAREFSQGAFHLRLLEEIMPFGLYFQAP